MNKKRIQCSERYARLFCIFFGIVAAVLIAEAAIRFLEPPADTKGIQLKNSERLFGFKENSKGYAGGVEFDTNSSGFRTEKFDNELVNEGEVVIVLGDSYAFGYGVRYQDSFPSILQRTLRKKYPDKNIRVVNLSIPGYNTAQELATLKEVGLNLRPKVVLLAYHLNDIETHIGEEERKGISLLGMIIDAKRDFHLLRFVLPRIAALGRLLHIEVETTATAQLQEYVTGGAAWKRNQNTLKELFDLCSENDCNLGIIVVPYIVQLTDDHPCTVAYQEVIDFCKSNSIPAVNAFEYFRAVEARNLWINAFDGHPNSQGQALIAEAADDLISSSHLLSH
jgi:lysophospholipase L1-like esterase